jgi:hypothetical protein
MVTVPAPEDIADVWLKEKVVGNAYWCMFQGPLVNLTVESIALPLVHQWAAALHASFIPDSADADQPGDFASLGANPEDDDLGLTLAPFDPDAGICFKYGRLYRNRVKQSPSSSARSDTACRLTFCRW